MPNTHFVIAIRNKVPVLVSGPPCIVTDNSDYTITFEPDAEWDAFPAKTVYYAFDTGEAIVHPIVGNEDAIPVLTKARMVYIGVSAGDLRTTKALGIRVQPSVRQMAGVEVPEPEPDTYDVIMEMLNGHEVRLRRVEENGGGAGGGTSFEPGFGLSLEDGVLSAEVGESSFHEITNAELQAIINKLKTEG